MNKTLMIVLITAAVTLMLAPKLRTLPGVSNLPTL